MLVLHPLVCIEKELDILSQSMTVNRSQFSRDVKNIPVNLSRSTDISIKISPTPRQKLEKQNDLIDIYSERFFLKAQSITSKRDGNIF